ncbi:hypothetical protein [Bdellovibrio reynosensis]|uniref:Uncharacterized protein n=1 Tax=Bdellovibrio reynosensis TaxID=2835041 RepID=A0ABY4CDQ4_9BACT|nr:hypothetical protein [Bdellovibrio reynosensis]UOF00325.1 hypothetical protein MNR06_11505 [Bdellovibrio reynosensis]
MIKKILALFLLFFSLNAFADLKPIPNTGTLKALETECKFVEERYPDFACIRFEVFQSSSRNLQSDLEEIIEYNEFNLKPTSWEIMREHLLGAMENQINRHADFGDLEPLLRVRDKNYWELLQLKKYFGDIQVDPHTYWYPSVDATSFVTVNASTNQIIIITHGERN